VSCVGNMLVDRICGLTARFQVHAAAIDDDAVERTAGSKPYPDLPQDAATPGLRPSCRNP
jgi:hypothetical protein